AGVKVLTEGLAHSLRNIEGCRVTAHLLVPGSTFTGMTARGRTEKPTGSWTPGKVIDVMGERVGDGDFYFICPDHAAPPGNRHPRRKQTPAASCGAPRTSSAIARRSRAGIPTTPTNSRHFSLRLRRFGTSEIYIVCRRGRRLDQIDA